MKRQSEIRDIMEEWGQSKFCKDPFVIFSDNLGAIRLGSHRTISDRAKHISTACFFFAEIV